MAAIASMSKQVSSGLVGVSSHTIPTSSGQSASQGVEIGQVDRRPRVAERAPHLGDQPERAAVRVVAEQDALALSEQSQDVVLGGEAAGERQAVARLLRARPPAPRARSGWGCPIGSTRSPCGCRRRPGRTWSTTRPPVTTAPVDASGCWPAWIARVEKPCRPRARRGHPSSSVHPSSRSGRSIARQSGAGRRSRRARRCG